MNMMNENYLIKMDFSLQNKKNFCERNYQLSINNIIWQNGWKLEVLHGKCNINKICHNFLVFCPFFPLKDDNKIVLLQ
jgi:hypothetical protein